MTGITLRRVKGSNLTADEADDNIVTLIAMIQAKQAQGVGIAGISVVGSEMFIALTDHTLLGPYNLPIASLDFRDAWAPLTTYYRGDIFTNNGTVYMVLINHTSAATFDAGATDGSGNNLYGRLLSNPSAVLPAGGATGMYLKKASSADFSMTWSDIALSDILEMPPASPGPLPGELLIYTSGGWTFIHESSLVGAHQALTALSDVRASPAPTNGQVPTWNSTDHLFEFQTPSGGGGSSALAGLTDVGVGSMHDGDILRYIAGPNDWENVPQYDSDQWVSSTRTLTLDDISKTIYCYGTAQTLTIPGAASGSPVTWPNKATIFLIHRAANQPPVTLSPDSGAGVTLIVPSGRIAAPRATGSIIRLTYIQSEQWLVHGDLAYEVSRSVEISDPGTGTISIPFENFDAEVYPYTPARSTTFNTTVSSYLAGRRFTFVFTTSGGTSYTMTFGTGFKSQGTLATGTVSGAVFSVSFVCDGTNFVEVSRTTAM